MSTIKFSINSLSHQNASLTFSLICTVSFGSLSLSHCITKHIVSLCRGALSLLTKCNHKFWCRTKWDAFKMHLKIAQLIVNAIQRTIISICIYWAIKRHTFAVVFDAVSNRMFVISFHSFSIWLIRPSLLFSFLLLSVLTFSSFSFYLLQAAHNVRHELHICCVWFLTVLLWK